MIKVSVVAPSSCNLDDASIKEAIAHLKEMGFSPVVRDDFINTKIPYHSNDDEYRARHLYEELCSEDSDILWCLRGGYGATRLIPILEKLPKPPKPKIVIGFSDITALHIFLSQKWKMKCIHGATVCNGIRKEFSHKNFEEVCNLITNKKLKVKIPEVKQMNNISSELSGKVVGGNLNIVTCSLGTNWQIITKGKILFLEDVEEKGYQIDRMLEHLKQCGIFDKVKGVILGQFTGGIEKDGSDYKNFALQRFANASPFPVFKTESIGHGFVNRPFMQDQKITIRNGILSGTIKI